MSSCATQSARDTLAMCMTPAQVNEQLFEYLARTLKAMGCATVTLVPVVEVAKDLLLSNPGAPALTSCSTAAPWSVQCHDLA